MTNFFYWKETADKIHDMLMENIDKSIAKTIVTGDFTLLPYPQDIEDFNSFFPCILIEFDNTEISYPNKADKVTSQIYSYNIFYLYPYGSRLTDVDMDSLRGTREIANVLMNNRTLEDLKLKKDNENSGFITVDSEISGISFDNDISRIFIDSDVPLSLSIIDFKVEIRTLSEKIKF